MQKKNGDKDGKVLCTLMNNAVYEKTVENLRNKIDIKCVSNKKDYMKWTSKPSCTSQKVFDKDLVAICKTKVTVVLNKPAYVAVSILDLSKVLMYQFHYDYIENRYGNNSRLLFTDSDSLMYEIKMEDVYEDFSEDKKNI